MIPARTRIWVCQEPQDMRRSFDGLAEAARRHVGECPEGGGLFVFANKRGNRAKLLWFDGTGQCLLYKRLSEGRFLLPNTQRVDVVALGEFLRGQAIMGKKRDR